MRKSDLFLIAAWTATIFGFAEGIVQCITRFYPAIFASYKVSPQVLWAAPVLNLLLFLPAAAGLKILAIYTHRWFDPSSLLTAYGCFIFLGVFPVITASGVIHPLASVILSAGFASFAWHKLRGYENQLTAYFRRRLIWVPVLLVAAGFGVTGYERLMETWHLHQLPPAVPGRSNVLLIVLDTVRYDSFARPSEKSLTPKLDLFVSKGVRFDNAWSTSSWSLPSQASILTGLYPHEHGADWPKFRLSEKYPTVAEFFARHGYVTGAFSGNAAWITPEYLGRGFLRFEVYIQENLFRRTVYGRIIGLALGKVGYNDAGRGKKAPQLNEQFLKFIDDHQSRPFFAYLCYMDVNQYFHDRRFNTRFLKQAPMAEVLQAYEQGLKVLDEQIGDLIAELERRRVLENTLVVVTSDHGESFAAAAINDHEPPGHGTSLYVEQVKVPLFVIFPGKLSGGQKVNRTVSIRAIPGAITRLVGLSDAPFHDEPLVSLQRRESSWKDSDPSVLATLNYDNRNQQTVIFDPWQYIKDLNSSHENKQEELYDLSADPAARNNLAPNHSALLMLRGRLSQQLEAGSLDLPPLANEIQFRVILK
jgi:arylsulfatase A-like enzyme